MSKVMDMNQHPVSSETYADLVAECEAMVIMELSVGDPPYITIPGQGILANVSIQGQLIVWRKPVDQVVLNECKQIAQVINLGQQVPSYVIVRAPNNDQKAQEASDAGSAMTAFLLNKRIVVMRHLPVSLSGPLQHFVNILPPSAYAKVIVKVLDAYANKPTQP